MSHRLKWQKYGVGYFEDLWGSYWERFNTIQIPIFGETDYFNYALEIAKLADGSEEEFKRIYAQRNKERMGYFLELLDKAFDRGLWHDEDFPCEDAADKVVAVCRTGSLEDFAQLLKGIAFGWEADTIHDIEGGTQSDDSYSGSDYGYWTRCREESEEWKDPKFREEMAACVTPLGVWFFQQPTGATSKEDTKPAESMSRETADGDPSVQKARPLIPGGACAAAAEEGEEEEEEEDEKKQDDKDR